MEPKKITKYVAALRIPCEEHGPHVVTVTADDETAYLCGDTLVEHLPFAHIDMQQTKMIFYQVEDDEIPF